MISTTKGAKAIETLLPGDKVYSYDTEKRENAISTVTDLSRRRVTEVLSIEVSSGVVIQATMDHPFYLPSENRWIVAEDLEIGMMLEQRGHKSGAEILSIRRRPATEGLIEVYNLSVTEPHNYFANDALVHNY